MEPTNCDLCQTSLERGSCNTYEDSKLVQSLCFNCNDEQTFLDYLSDKKLTTGLITSNWSILYDLRMKDVVYAKEISELENLIDRINIEISNKRINKKIKEFEKEVWFNGLQATINSSKRKGVSAKPGVFDNFCILTYSMCGRTMITIEDDSSSITVITSEDGSESRMGLQGICATEGEAIALIAIAIELYNNSTPPLVFVEDLNVSLGF